MPLVNVDKLIGRRNGLIKEVYTSIMDKSEPDIFSLVVQRGELPWEGEQERELQYGSGGGLTKIQALMSAIGETAERYCSSFVQKDAIVARATDLRNKYNILLPERIETYSRTQYDEANFPFKPFVDDKVEWVPAYSHKSKKEIYVPAFLVYLPYNKHDLGGAHSPASSSGLACASSLEQATDGAILELIERDALVVSWLNQLSPPIINTESEMISDILRTKFRFSDIDYHIVDLTSDFNFPVVAVYSIGSSSFGYVSAMGIAAHYSRAHALQKALLENALSRRAIHYYRKNNPDKKYRSDFSDVMNFSDHGYVYSTDKSYRNKIDFLFQGKSFSEHASDKNRESSVSLIDRIIDSGFDVITKDVTTPDIASVGLHVVRAVIPGLAQLHGIHKFPFLGSKRLFNPKKVFDWTSQNSPTEAVLGKAPAHMLP